MNQTDMIKQICLIAIVAMGLALLIPGANVEAKSTHHQSNLHKTSGNLRIVKTILQLKQHRDNPVQIPIGTPINPPRP
jgi:hypothetical protein